MNRKPHKVIISKKLSPLARPEIVAKVSRLIVSYKETGDLFIRDHLNSYQGNPKLICKRINQIASSDTKMGELFKKLININAEKIGKGEVFLDLVLKNAVSLGSENPDLRINKKKYEVKKISQSKIQFSEKHTENTDFGILVRMIQVCFSDQSDLYGEHMNKVSREQILNCKRLMKMFFNPYPYSIYKRCQQVVSIDNTLYRVKLKGFDKVKDDANKHQLIYCIDLFRNMINSNMTRFSEEMQGFMKGDQDDFYDFIEEVFSSYTLKEILKEAEGIYIVNDDAQFIYIKTSSINKKTALFINTISRNKIIFSFTKNITKQILLPSLWNSVFPDHNLVNGMFYQPRLGVG